MKLFKILLFAAALFVAAASAPGQQKADARPRGPYPGQAPPGTTPAIFAPGFISTGTGELNSVFTENGNEFYFSRRGVPGKPSAIMVTRMDSGAWSDPLPFAREATSEYEDYFPVVTGSGNLYFNSQRAGRGTNDIYCSKYINGGYTKPEILPGIINTQYREFDAFVTQDEKMIIYSSDRPGGFGGADLYISWKKADGTWSESRNLGETVNSEYAEYGATVTPDGKYLFFTSNRNESEDIYWVSIKVIEDLKPEK